MSSQVDVAAGAETPWYAVTPEDVGRSLSVDPLHGLTTEQVADRRGRDGPNELPASPPVPGWRRFVDEYRSYMQLILLGAAIVAVLIPEWSTVVVLLALTVLNAVLGLRQQGKAADAMAALQSMTKATARVRRDGGTEATVPAAELVSGDVVLLSAGDQVPADGRIVSANALQIDESALTGESVPSGKSAGTLPSDPVGPGDQADMVFMNTLVTHGSAVVVVTGTGQRTEVGKISGMLAGGGPGKSPLARQLDRLTLWIVGAAGLTMLVMFVLGRIRGESWDILFLSAVSLAIAAIPEALPTVSQAILSRGSLELAEQEAIVKDLSSVETLGFVSAINSDKTGTLTLNQMTAVEVVDPDDRYTVSGSGYELAGRVHHEAGRADRIDDLILPYLMANDATLVDGKVVGDPTEGALLVLGFKAGLDIDGTRGRSPRLATLPFDPTYKLMATFHRVTDARGREVVRCYVKGAAPAVTARSVPAPPPDSTGPIRDVPGDPGPDPAVWTVEPERRMAEAGLRVMAAATRDLEVADFRPDGDLLEYVRDLHLVSLVAMVDPPREQSAAAVAGAQSAHIRVRMVTGDDVITGAAIARKVGIPGEAMLGADFAALSESERRTRIDDIGVLGRVAPEHKVMLARTLQAKGDVVAMTGDGVNDAPAIKAADIGIAVGSGTEVAKESGRMILSNDNFATIVFAVEQGRKIFDNLLKYIRFVLVLLVVFVLTFLGATLFNIAEGAPFTPAQVLWIHFVVNAAFGFALGFDAQSPGLMTRPPRRRGQSITDRGVVVTVVLTGLVISAGLLGLILLGQERFDGLEVGRSIAFTSFAFCLIVSAFECRHQTATAFNRGSLESRVFNRVVIGEFVLAILVTQTDVLRTVLGTTRLTFAQTLWALVPALLLLALWELGKFVARRRTRPEPGAVAAG